jgi:mono/diheme cytochrome c family protein
MTSILPSKRAVGLWAVVGLAVVAFPKLAAGQAGRADSASPVTFTKDVAPILQRSCQNCHRPNGGVAPMSLTSYEEVRPWARAIKLRTSRREMPPWFIEKNIGIQQFKGDFSLSDQEIDTIARWVDAGAPRGDLADLPPPRQFSDINAWSIGEPDLIVDSPLLTVEAEAGDWHSPYVGGSDTGLAEDRWVAAFEVKEYRPGEIRRTPGRPGGGNDFFVLHHQAISSLPPYDQVAPEGDTRTDAERGAAELERLKGSLQYVYEVGQNAQYIPKDVGVALKAGGKIYFTASHLHSIGKKVDFHVRIGFKLHPKGYQPKYPQGMSLLRSAGVGVGAELDIPGNTDNVRFDRFLKVDAPVRMVTYEPHLHASGVRMCVEAMYPDGHYEMLNCSGYNHSWVQAYTYEDDYAPLLPAGTILHIIAWYDNTPKNPRVVDPRNWKGTGHRSIDDMIILLSRFIYYTEDEFKAVVAERAERLKKTRAATTTTAQND